MLMRRNIWLECKWMLRKALIFAICLFCLAISVVKSEGALAKLHEKMLEWPESLLALCGIGSLGTMTPGLVFFYVVLLLLHIVVIGVCACGCMNRLNREEDNGLLGFYMNQLYGKSQFLISKFMIALCSAVLLWCVYVGEVMVTLSITCKQLGVSADAELDKILQTGKYGIVFLIFSFSICLLYSAKREHWLSVGYMVFGIFSLSLFIGNAYKIFDLIGFYMREAQVDDSKIAMWGEILERLRVAFPFTCMNVLNPERQQMFGEMAWWYGGIGLVVLGLSFWCYGNRSEIL